MSCHFYLGVPLTFRDCWNFWNDCCRLIRHKTLLSSCLCAQQTCSHWLNLPLNYDCLNIKPEYIFFFLWKKILNYLILVEQTTQISKRWVLECVYALWGWKKALLIVGLRMNLLISKNSSDHFYAVTTTKFSNISSKSSPELPTIYL